MHKTTWLYNLKTGQPLLHMTSHAVTVTYLSSFSTIITITLLTYTSDVNIYMECPRTDPVMMNVVTKVTWSESDTESLL